MKHFSLLCMVLLLVSCSMTLPKTEKINGVSFVASRDSISEEHTKPVVNLNANYAAIMPFGFIKSLEHPEIIYNTDRQWFGETDKGVKQYIKALKKQQIKVMIKPQIWVSHGAFTGFIKMKSEEEWQELEQTYENFILDFAKVAEDINAEMLCIGTELENFVTHRPKFWTQLIKKIRTIYKGKLTYAANWNEFTKTPFWADLDYVGIDAYFPVSDLKTPTVEDCLQGWNAHLSDIKNVQKTTKKPILFTEFGYRSFDFSGKKPWLTGNYDANPNLEAQVNTTKALFKTFWEEDWFAGGFVWKWFHNYEQSGGAKDNMFTPQNKPAEDIIRQYYKK
ncbi:glycoside hydrolase family 113 [Mesoflavibacter zeaxanthinifaciens]|uniref:glycoside hydrolase family 113 n=1 Tax=Mesoflavibacter zeaxanthinifaciens TaxID=393060 RepID=UPI00047F2383|nr:glycoside hydrolase [Mesoflavibacter zeaxanthinifaciens]